MLIVFLSKLITECKDSNNVKPIIGKGHTISVLTRKKSVLITKLPNLMAKRPILSPGILFPDAPTSLTESGIDFSSSA